MSNHPSTVKATLTLDFHEDGSVSATGPLSNKMLCYAMLEMARDVIFKQSHIPQRLVEPADVIPPLRNPNDN